MPAGGGRGYTPFPMALVTFGGLVSAARGSVGGMTVSRNKGGAYLRARVAPINVKSPAQTLVRANFAANSKAWSGTLTPAQRASWTAFAQANPQINTLGASIIISGLAMYNKLNQVLAQIGGTQLLAPPVDLSVPALAAITGAISASGAGTVELQTDAQSVEAGAAYYVFATRPMAAGKTATTSDYRFVASVPAVAAAVVVDISAAYIALFGAIGEGASIGVQGGTVNTVSGAVTPALRFNIQAT